MILCRCRRGPSLSVAKELYQEGIHYGGDVPTGNPDTALCFCFPSLPRHHPRPLRRPTEHDDTLVTRCLCANTRNDRGRWAPVSPWAAEPYYGSLRLQYTQPKVGTEGRVTVCRREPPFSCLVVERVAVVLRSWGRRRDGNPNYLSLSFLYSQLLNRQSKERKLF